MISNSKIKYISALHQSKFRKKFSQFITEGHKLVLESIHSNHEVVEVYATEKWMTAYAQLVPKSVLLEQVSEKDMKRISALHSPSPVLAVVNIVHKKIQAHKIKNQLILALDNLQDPGNLGTIIRTADWFGIKHIVCSQNTVSCYNPKVVQASMGSIFHVDISYTDLKPYLQDSAKHNIPIYGTFLDGENILETSLTKNGIILIGNEGKGISKELQPIVNKRLLIPNFNANSGQDYKTAESLNASIATAIICYEFQRK